MNKRTVGTAYEQYAAEFLEAQGMKILARNYRIRTGEIDLIARDGTYLVFVEVKYRAGAGMGSPLEAVTTRKQQTILNTARHYLLRHGYSEDTPCRFDVIGIEHETVTHIRDAFWR